MSDAVDKSLDVSFFSATPLEKAAVKSHVMRARLKAGVLSGYDDFSGEPERQLKLSRPKLAVI